MRGCLLPALLFLASCASQFPPTGGEKDLVPPQVVKENPANLSVRFSEKKITITFDEYVQLNDAVNQVYFSPALTQNPQYRLKGKSLVITLPDSLRANTTYTINLGSAVKDNTEGNILFNYQYVFSTGKTIDSLRIRGRVLDAPDGSSRSNLLVMLHSDLSDSAVALRRPEYNARTDSFGYFTLDYLRGNNYRLSVVEDQNFDLKYDQPGERIGFYDSVIAVADTLGFYPMLLFKAQPATQSLLNTFSRQPGRVSFAFARPTEQMAITPAADTLRFFRENNLTNDTLSIWVNDTGSDSLLFVLKDVNFSDTVKARMKGPDGRQKTSPVPEITVAHVSFGRAGMPLRKNDPLVLFFNSPVDSVHAMAKIFLRDDSVKKEYEVKPELYFDSSAGKQRAKVEHRWVDGRRYALVIPDSAFRNLFGSWNDSTEISIPVYAEEQLGNLDLKISFADSTTASAWFYELTSKEGVLISKEKLPARSQLLTFSSLPAGEYSFRITEDRNNNLRWDTGDYWKHRQPERIFFYLGAITIRENWDVDAQMKIDNR
jgi:hypothetical protein